MNAMADAMLKSGIIQKDDIEAAEKRELLARETLEEEKRAKRRELRKLMGKRAFRKEFKKRARGVIKPLIVAEVEKRAGPPKDFVDRSLREAMVDAMVELQVEKLQQEM